MNVPIAPGVAYPERINSLYFDLRQQTGKSKEALTKLKEALAYAFDTQIDYYVLVDFDGLVKLIDAIGGIEVTLEEELIDPVHAHRLTGPPPPGRHAPPRRARRPSHSHARATRTVTTTARGASSRSSWPPPRRSASEVLAALPALVELAHKRTITDIPLRAAPALLELAGRADLADPRSVVLEPVRWARVLPDSYTISPRVLEVQKLFDRLFEPLG